MPYEVELKFPLSGGQADGLRQTLGDLPGTEESTPIRQADRYFNHPARDFASTGEALRIRTVGGVSMITYKGSLEDAIAKTRKEIELRFADPVEAALAEMLSLLGFTEVFTVEKTRTPFTVQHRGSEVELVIDEVDRLGTFVELELVADEADREAAGASLLDLAAELGLENATRRSYLGMLLEKEAQNCTG